MSTPRHDALERRQQIVLLILGGHNPKRVAAELGVNVNCVRGGWNRYVREKHPEIFTDPQTKRPRYCSITIKLLRGETLNKRYYKPVATDLRRGAL
jgi:transposase